MPIHQLELFICLCTLAIVFFQILFYRAAMRDSIEYTDRILSDLKTHICAIQFRLDKFKKEIGTNGVLNSLDYHRKIIVKHAERLDAIAKFLKIDYIDTIPAQDVKEYQKIK